MTCDGPESRHRSTEGRDLAARAQELCEDTLKQLENPVSHDEDTIDNVYLQLAELETLHAWGHPAEEDRDVAKAAHLLREHQSDVIRQDGGTNSQPAGLTAAQPQLPLRALRTLRVLEPFLAGQERDLVLQAMGGPQQLEHPVLGAPDRAGQRTTTTPSSTNQKTKGNPQQKGTNLWKTSGKAWTRGHPQP